MQTNEVEIFVDFSEQTEENCEKCKEECTSLEQMLDRGGVRYRHSFSSRLIQAEDALKQSYSQIKNLLLSFSGVRCRVSQSAESFKLARVHLSRLNVKGKALVVELALDPSGFDAEKYHFEDNSAHCAELPMRMRVRSPRSLRYCLELIGEQMRRMGLVADESYEFVDFAPPYETSEELIGRGLIKVIEPTAEEATEACIEDAPLLLNDAPIDAPSALDPIFVLSDAPFTDDTEVSDGCSERCTEPSDPIIVESDDGALNGEAICERREPSPEDTRVSVNGGCLFT